jgi:tetratricopeptide (TPR) repeat protein
VDFYIRLGFHNEALAKLNEIAKLNPDNPELASRYQKLNHVAQEPAAGTADAPAVLEEYHFDVSTGFNPPGETDASRESATDDSSSGFAIFGLQQAEPELHQEPLADASLPSAEAFGAWRSEEPHISTVVPIESDTSGFQANEMFADLMDDVGGAPNEDAAVDSFEDHFSLGTAYREMELVDEAIKEFESALKSAQRPKDTRKIIQCCGMLSTCFLEKGMARSALRWCQTGLGIADNSSHEAMALRYDMGVAHLMSGSNERAIECFDRIFSMDPGYRDVAQRIDALKSGSNRHAP